MAKTHWESRFEREEERWKEERQDTLDYKLLRERFPDEGVIGSAISAHINKEILHRDKINNKGANVPLDLIHGSNHYSEMMGVFHYCISETVREITKSWSVQEIRILLKYIKEPQVNTRIAGDIYDKFPQELLSFDFGPQMPKNFGGIMLTSALYTLINAMEKEIDSINLRERIDQKENAKTLGERIIGRVIGLLPTKG